MGEETWVDYYELLQVSPRADQETIARIYRLLAKRFHPDNKNTGDACRFDALTKAFRALSDPEKRAAYDAGYESAQIHQLRTLLNAIPSDDALEDKKIYQAVLSVLYTTRRQDPEKPGVGIFQLEKILGLPEKYLEFHLWYLREKGWIQRTENGALAITASGVDAVITDDLLLRKDRLLPAGEKAGRRPDDLEIPEPGLPVDFAGEALR